MPCSHPKAQKAPDISIFDTMYGAFLRSNRGPLFHCTYDRFTHGESLEGFKDVLRKSPSIPLCKRGKVQNDQNYLDVTSIFLYSILNILTRKLKRFLIECYEFFHSRCRTRSGNCRLLLEDFRISCGLRVLRVAGAPSHNISFT